MSTSKRQPDNIREQDPELTNNSLNDADTLSFINSLIDQNSELAFKLQQVDALKKLAEDQSETARAEAEKIISEAKQIIEQDPRKSLQSSA